MIFRKSNILPDQTLRTDHQSLGLWNKAFTVMGIPIVMVTKSILSDSPHASGTERNKNNPNQSPGFVVVCCLFVCFLQPCAVWRNDWCPTWVSIEIEYRHYPCHNSKHNDSNSDDVNAQTSFHLKEGEKKWKTNIKSVKEVFKMVIMLQSDYQNPLDSVA